MELDKAVLLRRIPLFAGLNELEISELARVAMEKRYLAGQSLFQEGDECEGLFVLARGSVKIYRNQPGGREMTLAVERSPGTVAELSLFDGGPYPAGVSAIEELDALLIRKNDFRSVCL